MLVTMPKQGVAAIVGLGLAAPTVAGGAPVQTPSDFVLGNGIACVDDLNEARRLFGPALDQGAVSIADDVKIQVEFNPVLDSVQTSERPHTVSTPVSDVGMFHAAP